MKKNNKAYNFVTNYFLAGMVAKSADLTMLQLVTLYSIANAYSFFQTTVSIPKLANKFGISRGGATITVKHLLEKKYIKIIAIKSGNKTRYYAITQKARLLLKQLDTFY